MTTIIDSLIMTLGLDASDFEKGQKEASTHVKKLKEDAEKTSKEMQESGKKAAEFFSEIKKQALEMFAVFMGAAGLKSFIESTVDSTEKLHFLSQTLGMNENDVRAFGRASRDTGGSIEAMNAHLQATQDLIGKRKLGISDTRMDQLYAFGVSHDAFSRDVQHTMEEEAKALQFNKAKYGLDAATQMAAMAGISRELIPLMINGPEAMMERVAGEHKSGDLTDAQIKRMVDIKEKMNQLGDTFKMVGVNILDALMPVFEDLLHLLEDFATWLQSHKEDIKEWFDMVVPKIEAFGRGVMAVIDAFGGWPTVLTSLTALLALKFVSSITGLLGLSGALMSVGNALKFVVGVPGVGVILGLLATAFAAYKLAEDPDHPGMHNANAPSKSFDDLLPGLSGDLKNLGKPSKYSVGETNTSPRNTENILSFIKSLGFNDDQAAGIYGSMKQESQWNPTSLNKSGAYGIGQWTKDRLGRLKSMFPDSWWSMASQQSFMRWERNTHVKDGGEKENYDKIQYATSAERAAVMHSQLVERPGKELYKSRDDLRVAYTRAILNQAHGSGKGVGSSTSSVETNIDTLHIHTQATDADSMAKDVQSSLSKHPMVGQMNSGVLLP